MEGNCGFCGRLKEMTFHHFIPKTLHSNKLFRKLYTRAFMLKHGIDLCKDCHKTIHTFYTEKELGKYYNDKDKLLASENIANFVKWVKKQS